MNNIEECQVVQDLLQNYSDGVLNEESKKLVENHLKTCSKCQKKLEKIKKDTEPNLQKKEIEYLKKIKRKSDLKTISIILLILFFTVFIYFLRNFIILSTITAKSFDFFDDYLENRALFKKKEDANKRKIYLWIKHCDNLVKDMDVEEYDSSKLPLLLEELRQERNKPFNKERLINMFAKYGIYFVIEDAIQGTKARGCMMLKKTNPAIYLTTYYKEKSSFYYALYHELKHVKSDYNKGKAKILIDDEVETEADLFALNEMMPEKTWEEILNNYDQREAICQRENIPLCFLYGRLAYNGLIKYSSKEYNAHKEMI